MDKLNLDARTLKKFGITMAIAFLVIAGLLFFRHKNGALPILVISFIFSIVSLASPNLLRPLYIVWMHFAFILGWINTRIILVILFYLIFTPIGLVMRLFRIDLLERKNINETYWKKKDVLKSDLLDYERRF